MRKPIKQTFCKLLFVSGLLVKTSSRGKIRLRKMAYIYILLFPLFILILLRAYYIMWRVRCQKRKEESKASYKYHLSIVAIAKNESEYIGEWLVFHKLIGVEKVYLYDNDSTDNMRDVLEPYIADGFVVYNEVHGKRRQFDAYDDALRRYGHLTKYMAFIDCDEFMMPLDSEKSLLEIVESIFVKDENAGGIGMNWCIFGSSGYKTKPAEGLVMENYTRHSVVSHERNYTIKTIVKPTCVIRFSHPHYPEYKPGFYGINLEGEIILNWWNKISEYTGIRLNHYYCKSWEEYVKRNALGKPDRLGMSPVEQFYKDDRNEVLDESILIYANDVKNLIYGR